VTAHRWSKRTRPAVSTCIGQRNSIPDRPKRSMSRASRDAPSPWSWAESSTPLSASTLTPASAKARDSRPISATWARLRRAASALPAQFGDHSSRHVSIEAAGLQAGKQDRRHRWAPCARDDGSPVRVPRRSARCASASASCGRCGRRSARQNRRNSGATSMLTRLPPARLRRRNVVARPGAGRQHGAGSRSASGAARNRQSTPASGSWKMRPHDWEDTCDGTWRARARHRRVRFLGSHLATGCWRTGRGSSSAPTISSPAPAATSSTC